MNDKEKEIKDLKERLNKLEESNTEDQKEEKAKPGSLSQILVLLVVVLGVSYFLSDNSEPSPDTAQQEKPQKISPTQAQISQVLGLLKSENTDVVDALYNNGGSYNEDSQYKRHFSKKLLV